MICSNCKNDVSDDSLYCEKCGQSIIGSDLQITRNDFTHKLNNTKILDFKNGESFGERYKMISVLGKGGMGQVFKAHDSVLDIDVALKMIRPEFLMNKKMISRFKQEILLAREITHENVSRIYDFGEVDGTKFISMEFISGRTLKDIVKNDGPIEIEKAIKISKAICNGLSAAHKKEIIHRDLKPQNIMIDENDHVYITDFGLAKSIKEENVSHTGLVIGTPQYIPPELWKGEVADKRSDIYSLGIIMYEMVTGEELFQSDSDYGYLQKHVNEEPEFPDEIIDKLPSFYNNVILKCLFKDRAKRYQDCSDIYRDLEDKVYTKGTLISELERSIKKTGLLKIGLFIGLILLISFFGSMILKKGPPVQKKRSVAILYFKNLSGMKDLDHYSYSLPELLATDLGQSKYIRVLPDDKVSKILKESNYLTPAFIDEKMFEDLGDKAKVNYLVQGSFIQSGKDLRITVKLRDSDTGEMLSTDYVDASADNIFPAIDRLTTGLKRRLNLTENEIFADIDSEVESITTSSQDALNHYITGKRLFNNRKFRKSMVEYQKAVDIDPEFAMAYRNMAWSYAHLNDWDNRKKYFEKTIQYIDKLSEREKYLIYGDYYAEKEITFQKALDSYQKILDIYPHDFEANKQIGMLYRIFENWDKGINHLKKALKEDNSSIQALAHLVYCFKGKGDYSEAEKLIKIFVENNGESNRDRILRFIYILKLDQSEFSLALNIVDKRNELVKNESSGINYNCGVVNILQGDFKKANNVILKLKSPTNPRNYPAMRSMKYLYLFQGKFKSFEDQLKKDISEAPYISNQNEYNSELVRFYVELGLYKQSTFVLTNVSREAESGFPIEKFLFLASKVLNEIAMGNEKSGKVLIEELEVLSKNSFYNKLTSRMLFFLKGRFYENNGNEKLAEKFYKKSLEHLKQRLDFRDAANYYYYTGLFYINLNKFEEAKEYFEHILKLSHGRLYRGDLFAKSFYYLGKIYQRRGWTGKAIKSYKRFYNMWKDGDPQFVGKYLTDTEKQLVILKHRI